MNRNSCGAAGLVASPPAALIITGLPRSQHVVFGEVVDGMNVVKAVEKLGTSSGRTNGTIKISDCGRL